MNKTGSFWRTHREALVFLYFPVYLLWFFMLEQMEPENLFFVTNPLDHYIPFCEYFIVPYLLWFPYLFGGLFWFYRWERKSGFMKFALTLIAGLTICLFIYMVFPNAQALRPNPYPRDNFFTDVVKLLQGFDTPTNVCPSIHVFSTVALHIAVMKSEVLRKKRYVTYGSWILAVSICLSTVFLKQHSFTDVICALALNAVLYFLIYRLLSKKFRCSLDSFVTGE
ncbi:MAG: phosphatase PAP2 family protein [Roseburia sp.]|nr:phosphatase PAP2 family protein [Roseburia sp.]